MNDIKDYHKDLLFLLMEIDEICSRNNIKYSLFGGTLIGAIRHKGFIPWDDDADVVFERNQYEKFIRVLPSDFIIFRDLCTPRFGLKSNSKIFVDIFIFDITVESVIIQKMQILGLKILQGTLKKNITTNKGIFGSIASWVTYIIGLPLKDRFKLLIYDKLAVCFNNKKSGYTFSSYDQYKYIGLVLPKKILKSYQKVAFNNTKLMIMEGYDLYLTKFYGDYMKLPSEENRKPLHGKLL